MASHTYLTMPSSNLRLCSHSWCWTQHSWLMSTGSHRVSADLTNLIPPAPCQCLMWLGSDLIGVVLSSKTSSLKPDTSYYKRKIQHNTTNIHFFDYGTLSLQYSKILSSFVPVVSLPPQKRWSTCAVYCFPVLDVLYCVCDPWLLVSLIIVTYKRVSYQNPYT